MSAAPVLIVDDDSAIVEVVGEALRGEGFAIEAASCPHEAVALLLARGADAYGLIVTDSFAGPHDDPYGWLDQLRSETMAPILLCTGWPAALYADYRTRGCAAFLEKPFDLDDLTALVAALVLQAPRQCVRERGSSPGQAVI